MRHLIPAPVRTCPETGVVLPYWKWIFPRSAAYEAAVRPTLPTGWELYSVIDGEKHPDTCARDFGATRDDRRAYVFGVREIDGTPRNLHAHVMHCRAPEPNHRVFQPGELAEACRWCDEQIAKAIPGQ